MPQDKIVVVGARDLDPGEDEAIATSRIRACEVHDLLGAGLPDGPVWVHVDLDVLDPRFVPSASTPSANGLSPIRAAGVLGASFLQLVTVSTMNWQTFSELAFSFTLTPRILDLGFAYLSSMPIWNVARGLLFLAANCLTRVDFPHPEGPRRVKSSPS